MILLSSFASVNKSVLRTFSYGLCSSSWWVTTSSVGPPFCSVPARIFFVVDLECFMYKLAISRLKMWIDSEDKKCALTGRRKEFSQRQGSSEDGTFYTTFRSRRGTEHLPCVLSIANLPLKFCRYPRLFARSDIRGRNPGSPRPSGSKSTQEVPFKAIWFKY